MRAHDAFVASVPAPALRAFGDRFHGRLIFPTDQGYDEARSIWNGAIDRTPGLVARCAGTSDVGSAVRFAREHDLRMSVRSGGHGVGGLALCDDGLVVDLVRVEGCPGRRGKRPRGGRGRGHPRRARSRHAGVRARGRGRDRDAHGGRRSHPRRRDRVADPQARPERRQPRGRRRRHRGRAAGRRRRGRPPRPVLGTPGGRGQLRRGHVVPLPSAPDRADGVRGTDALPARARSRG